jgi:hypothetical protein
MPNITFTQLPPAGPITGTETVAIVQNGQTLRTTTAALAASPVLTQTFLTLNQEPTLNNSRYFGAINGLSTVDGGAQSVFNITTTGALLSLVTSSTGFQVKTSGTTIAGRSMAVSGVGLSISNGDGIAGNPTITLAGQVSNLANLSANGLLTITTAGVISATQIAGVAGETLVLNANGTTGYPTIGLATDPTIPGTGAIQIPAGSSGQRPAGVDGKIRYNSTDGAYEGYSTGSWRQFSLSGGVTQVDTGTGLTGGPITGIGTISIANTAVVAGSYGSATQVGTFAVNAQGQLTAAANVTITPAGIGAVASVSGTANEITATGTTTVVLSLPAALTFTGKTVTGGSFVLPIISSISNSGTITVPTGTDTLVARNTTDTLTNKSISGTGNTLTNIGNSSLTNSTISGVSLGSNLFSLTIGTGLTGTSYNGSAAVTVAIDSTVVTITGTQTLTNKSISGSDNTLTNISNGALTNSSLTIGTTAISLGSSSLTLGGLTSVAVTQDPTTALQLATKQYVDAVAEGLHIHASCDAATTGTLASLTGGTVTYNNGTAGVGATLTLSVALVVVDGYTLLNGNRLMVKNEATQANNGIYTWATGGTVLTRATDFDTAVEIASGDFSFITNGTLYAGTGWVQTQPVNTVGTDAIIWQQFSGAGTYTAGTGLTLTGTQFSITNTGVTAGAYGSATQVGTFTVNAQGQLTIAGNTTVTPAIGSITGLGTGVTAALAVNTGSTGAFAVMGSAASFTTVASTIATGTAPFSVASTTTVVNLTATNTVNTGVTTATSGATNYLTFVTATSGNLPQLVNSSITANASTGTITGGISGGAF